MALNIPRPPSAMPPDFQRWAGALAFELERFGREIFGPQVETVAGIFKVVGASAVPATPPAGQFYLYMDLSDNKLKAIGPSGTITEVALP